MNIKSQRLLNLLIGIFFISLGLYFANLCATYIYGFGSDVITAEVNSTISQNPAGENLSQLILSAMCAIAGIVCGASHLWFLVFNTD